MPLKFAHNQPLLLGKGRIRLNTSTKNTPLRYKSNLNIEILTSSFEIFLP